MNLRLIAERLVQFSELLGAGEVVHHSGDMCVTVNEDTTKLEEFGLRDWGIRDRNITVTMEADLVLRGAPIEDKPKNES